MHPADALACDLFARYRLVSDSSALTRPSGDLNAVARRVERAYQDGTRFEPQFDYAAADASPEVSADMLTLAAEAGTAAALMSDPLLGLFADFLRREAAMASAMRTHDADEIQRASELVHGSVTGPLLTSALELLEAPRATPTDSELSSTAAANVLSGVLQAVEADGWSVEVSDTLLARMAVSPTQRLVKVRSDVSFPHSEVVRLAVHEIGVHVVRTLAGGRQASPLLAVGLGPRHLVTEEGLAVWAEQATGVSDPEVTSKYAGRVVAVHTARVGSFFDVYSSVRPHFSAQSSFDMTLRVKRAISDPSRPGCYSKDKAYLEGLLEAQQVLGSRPTQEGLALRQLMWAAKGSFDMLDVLACMRDEGRLVVASEDPMQTLVVARDTARALLGPAQAT